MCLAHLTNQPHKRQNGAAYKSASCAHLIIGWMKQKLGCKRQFAPKIQKKNHFVLWLDNRESTISIGAVGIMLHSCAH